VRGREAVQCAAQHGNAPEAAAALAAEQWEVLEGGVAQQVLELLAVLLQPPVARPRRALEEERALPLPVQLGEDVGLLAVLLAAARLPASAVLLRLLLRLLAAVVAAAAAAAPSPPPAAAGGPFVLAPYAVPSLRQRRCTAAAEGGVLQPAEAARFLRQRDHEEAVAGVAVVRREHTCPLVVGVILLRRLCVIAAAARLVGRGSGGSAALAAAAGRLGRHRLLRKLGRLLRHLHLLLRHPPHALRRPRAVVHLEVVRRQRHEGPLVPRHQRRERHGGGAHERAAPPAVVEALELQLRGVRRVHR
jgi:hypothetical protein